MDGVTVVTNVPVLAVTRRQGEGDGRAAVATKVHAVRLYRLIKR